MLPILGPVSLPIYRLAALVGSGAGPRVAGAWSCRRVFGRLAWLVSSPIPGVGPEALPRLSGRLLDQGLLWSTAGWVLLGLSQLAVVRSFDPDGAKALVVHGLVPVVIASVALATVAGFVVAVFPGGLGVREGVLMSALAPALGSDRAVVAALMLRLVWVAAELAAAIVLVPLFRRPSATGDSPPGSRSDPVMISVVIPVHNEEESLAALHDKLAAVFADGRARARPSSSSWTTAAATAPGMS